MRSTNGSPANKDKPKTRQKYGVLSLNSWPKIKFSVPPSACQVPRIKPILPIVPRKIDAVVAVRKHHRAERLAVLHVVDGLSNGGRRARILGDILPFLGRLSGGDGTLMAAAWVSGFQFMPAWLLLQTEPKKQRRD